MTKCEWCGLTIVWSYAKHRYVRNYQPYYATTPTYLCPLSPGGTYHEPERKP